MEQTAGDHALHDLATVYRIGVGQPRDPYHACQKWMQPSIEIVIFISRSLFHVL